MPGYRRVLGFARIALLLLLILPFSPLPPSALTPGEALSLTYLYNSSHEPFQIIHTLIYGWFGNAAVGSPPSIAGRWHGHFDMQFAGWWWTFGCLGDGRHIVYPSFSGEVGGGGGTTLFCAFTTTLLRTPTYLPYLAVPRVAPHFARGLPLRTLPRAP